MLAFINVALFILINAEGDKYKISTQQESAVLTLLSNNKVEITAAIPKQYKPMKSLNMQPYIFDIDEVYALFFEPDELTEKVDTWNRQSIYLLNGDGSQSDKVLSLEDNILRFDNPDGYKTPEFTEKGYGDVEAEKLLCDEFIKKIVPPSMEFVFGRTEVNDEEAFTSYFYRGYYRGYMIYSNTIRLQVSENGITIVRCSYSGVADNFSSVTRDIYSADEALFTLLTKELRIKYRDNNVVITNIEIVYNLNDASTPGGEVLPKAVPCYKIDVFIDGYGVTYLIDAYTNEIIK